MDELKGVTLEAQGSGFYKGSNGKKYRLQAVDRQYRQEQKKPVYFLQELRAGKAEYISGLFLVAPGLFSFDVKDNIGVKHFYTLDMRKEPAIIQKGRRRAQAVSRAL